MKCTECGYEYNSNAENWVYHGDACYEIKSHIINAQLLNEIAEHAISVDSQLEEINIDTWLIDCLPCNSCSLLNIRNQINRLELGQEYDSRELYIYYYF